MSRDIYQEVTDKVVAMMETSGTNWTNPMTGGAKGWPFNPVTGNTYNGLNVLFLSMAGGGAFASFKQWQAKGCKIKKGSKGERVIFFKPLNVKDRTDPDGERMIKIPMIKTYTVFSADQVEGEFAEQYQIRLDQPDETQQIAAVDEWVAATGAVINTRNEGKAFYRPSTDEIQMPPRNGFQATDTSTASENYHSTLLHELTHWTGHKSRLDRLALKNQDGYAFEELIAELGAAFQCIKLGVSSEPRADHAKYLNNWLAALKNDKKLIVKAARLAQQAVDHIESYQSSNEQEAA